MARLFLWVVLCTRVFALLPEKCSDWETGLVVSITPSSGADEGRMILKGGLSKSSVYVTNASALCNYDVLGSNDIYFTDSGTADYHVGHVTVLSSENVRLARVVYSMVGSVQNLNVTLSEDPSLLSSLNVFLASTDLTIDDCDHSTIIGSETITMTDSDYVSITNSDDIQLTNCDNMYMHGSHTIVCGHAENVHMEGSINTVQSTSASYTLKHVKVVGNDNNITLHTADGVYVEGNFHNLLSVGTAAGNETIEHLRVYGQHQTVTTGAAVQLDHLIMYGEQSTMTCTSGAPCTHNYMLGKEHTMTDVSYGVILSGQLNEVTADGCVVLNGNSNKCNATNGVVMGGVTAGLNASNMFFNTGSCWCSSVHQTSDQRVKQNAQDLASVEGLDVINALRPRTYTYHPAYAGHTGRTSERVAGLFAQEVEEIVPTAVLTSEGTQTFHSMYAQSSGKDYPLGDIQLDVEGLKSVQINRIVPYLIAAVQHLSAQLDDAVARIAALEQV